MISEGAGEAKGRILADPFASTQIMIMSTARNF